MTEIQGKSILVRVSARFELARVRVIESQLYLMLLLLSGLIRERKYMSCSSKCRKRSIVRRVSMKGGLGCLLE